MDWRISEFLKLQYVYMIEALKSRLPRNYPFKLQWWWFGHREASLNPKQTCKTPPVQKWRHNDFPSSSADFISFDASVELIIALDLRGKGVCTQTWRSKTSAVNGSISRSIDPRLWTQIWFIPSRSSALNEPEHTIGTKSLRANKNVSALYCTECVILGAIVLFRIKLTLIGFNTMYQSHYIKKNQVKHYI